MSYLYNFHMSEGRNDNRTLCRDRPDKDLDMPRGSALHLGCLLALYQLYNISNNGVHSQ